VNSVIRYTAARCTFSQLWAPPWVVYLLVIAIAYPPGGRVLDSLSIGSALLLPVAAWIGLATLGSETAAQQASVAAAAGGPVRYRIGALGAATLAALALVPFSIAWALVQSHGAAGADGTAVAMAVLAHVSAALMGVSIAAALSRPLVRRPGFVLLWALLVVVALVVVPHLPPVRLSVELLEAGASTPGLLACIGIALGTAALAGAVWWWTSVLSSRRS
jgi:hypothetical protein